MSGYLVETSTHRVGSGDFHMRALLDRQQFDDPDGVAEALGISSAQWSLFGVLWPSGLALADEMSRFPIAGKRILEVGCGLGLASLVLQPRGADITASDHHPLAEAFLNHNAALNGLGPVAFRAVAWAGPNLDLGAFDLVIGSDVLYERGHAALLSSFLSRHASAASEVMLTDPGRAHRGHFRVAMAAQGYSSTDRRVRGPAGQKASHVLGFTRRA